MSAERKSYSQVCPMSTALDIVGDRWSILILRELLGGPARFVDLLEGLPGIARNLLTARLRQLEGDGVVRRIGRGRGAEYAVTDQGAAIRPALESLAFWGARQRRVSAPEHGRSIRATAMALQAIFVHGGGPLPEQTLSVEVDVDGAFLDLRLGPQPTATARPGVHATTRLRVPADTMVDLLAGRPVFPDDFVRVAGEEAGRRALLAVLRLCC